MKNVRGFTLVEAMAAIFITLILAGLAGMNVGRAIENSKQDQTALALKTAAGDLELYIAERGPLVTMDTESESEAAKRFVNDFNANFSSMTYGTKTLNASSRSFTADASVKTDAWGTPFRLYYSWSNGMFVVASAGPDTKFEFQSGSAGDMDDVLVAVVAK